MGTLVRPVVGLRVPYLHMCTTLPGCFNTGNIIHPSPAPFLKTVELLWQQFKNKKISFRQTLNMKNFLSMGISGTAISSSQQKFVIEALSKYITSPALKY